MKIIVKNSVERIEITKTERRLLQSASALLASIGRHGASESVKSLSDCSAAIEAFLSGGQGKETT